MSPIITTELARERTRPFWYVTLGGRGRMSSATTAARRVAYRWCEVDPYDYGYSLTDSDKYVPRLLPLEGTLGESVSLREGVTQLGSFAFRLLDGPLPARVSTAHGWSTSDLVTDLLAERVPCLTWTLTANATAATTTFNLASVAGITTNRHYWIGAEAVCVTATDAGLLTATVVRACLGTEAQAHAIYPDGEGVLYERPQYLRGLAVEVWVNWILDDGTLAAESEAVRWWRGTLDEYEQDGPNTWSFRCKPALGKLDRTIGRSQFVADADFAGEDAAAILAKMQADEPVALTLRLPEGDGAVRVPNWPVVSSYRNFLARLGDQIVEAKVAVSDDGTTIRDAATVYCGLLGTEIKRVDKARVAFWEVLTTSPDPAPSLVTPFVAGTIYLAHPVDIALALMTSTGAGTNGDHDILRSQWGAGIPVAQVNTTSFLALRGRTQHLRMPALVIGWEGKPFNLRKFLEENVLGPFGIFLFLDADGLIAAGSVLQYYPTDSWQILTSADFDDRYLPRLVGQLQETIAFQTWTTDYDLATDKPRLTLKHRHPQVVERLQDDDSDISRECRGLAQDGSALAVLQAQANLFSESFIAPLPVVECAVAFNKLRLDLTEGVLLTHAALPNPFTGTRGMTNVPAVVLSRSIDIGEGVCHLTLLLVPEINVGLWAPCGTVKSYVAGTLTVTLETNDHSTPDPWDEIPAVDADGFAAGDKIMLLDADLAVRSDTVVTIASHVAGTDTFVLTSAFQSGGADISPAATDRIVYVHYESGGTPAGAWTARMLGHVAQADDADELLPNGDDAYVYGRV